MIKMNSNIFLAKNERLPTEIVFSSTNDPKPGTTFHNNKAYTFVGTGHRKLSYFALSRLKQIALLIFQIFKGVIIYPLFTKKYYSALKEAYAPIGTTAVSVYSEGGNITLWQRISLDRSLYQGAAAIKNKEKKMEWLTTTSQALMAKHSSNPLVGRYFMGRSMEWSLRMPSWTLNMPAVALIATYLKEKKGLDGLYVCSSLEAFRDQLSLLSEMKDGEKKAFIIAARPWSEHFNDIPDTQHKVSICVEKIKGRLHIAVLNSQPHPGDRQITLFKKSVEDIRNGKGISLTGVIFWYIFQSNLNLENVELYYSMVPRERQYGCETYALKDSITFLKGSDFFKKSKFFDFMGHKEIGLLPPEFMKGTQSISELEHYRKDHSELANTPFSHSKNNKPCAEWNIQECLKAHTVSVNGKDQNHYISQRSFKYHLIAIELLKTMSTEELVKAIKKSLVEPLVPYQWDPKNPKTLNDLFPQNTFSVDINIT